MVGKGRQVDGIVKLPENFGGAYVHVDSGDSMVNMRQNSDQS